MTPLQPPLVLLVLSPRPPLILSSPPSAGFLPAIPHSSGAEVDSKALKSNVLFIDLWITRLCFGLPSIFSSCRGTVHTASGSQPPSAPSVEPSEVFPVLTNELQPERWRTSYVSLVRAVVCLLLFHRGAVKECLCRTGFCFPSTAYVKWTTNVQLSTAGLIAGIFNQSHWENSILLK